MKKEPEHHEHDHHVKREVNKFTASEWAIMKKRDHHIYLAWKQPMSEEEFNELMKNREGN